MTLDLPALFGVPASAVDDVRARMTEKLRALDGDSPFPSALPPGFAEVLAVVIAREEAEQSGRAALLWNHYFDLMPRQRQVQLATREGPQGALFFTPLEWERMPRWRSVRDGLFAALQHRSLVVEGETFAELYARTYYGGCMPLLYGQPADLAYASQHLQRTHDPLVTLDTHFAAPLLHELAHLGRDTPALFPLYLDECVAGYVGVHAWSRFAYPNDDDRDAIYAAPWFAQVGQALASVAGMERLLDAHAGILPWSEALPNQLAATLGRIGADDYVRHRRPHLLADGFSPAPWLKLIFAGAAGETITPLDEIAARPFADLPVGPNVPNGDEQPFDLVILRDALRAMCLSNQLVAGHFVVTPTLPPVITIDLDECVVRATVHEVQLAYLFPPAMAARLRRQNRAGLAVTLRDRAALDELVLRISDGKPVESTAFSIARTI